MEAEHEAEQLVLPGWSTDLSRAKYDPKLFALKGTALTSLHAGLVTVDHLHEEPHLKMIPFAALYTPCVNDLVIGTVKHRTAEAYVLDIYGAHDANLNQLDFDGATKRNKPNLQAGTLVYCRVVSYGPDLGAKLTCLCSGSKNQLGELKGGVSLFLRNAQIGRVKAHLAEVGKITQFEIALGRNGLIWITHKQPRSLMILRNLLLGIANKLPSDRIIALMQLLK